MFLCRECSHTDIHGALINIIRMATKKRRLEEQEMQGFPTSLVTLPNELPSIILQQIDEKDRLSVAYVRRRLNDFVASSSHGPYSKYLRCYSNLCICNGRHNIYPNFACLKALCTWVISPPQIPVMTIKFSNDYLGQLRLLTHCIERFPECERPIVHVYAGHSL
ncbi:hypothetical protein DFS33DRAFT_239028 [Desarmillaria ectypa]|nr:hypothetical protein DFS33DRAFT_239028 [Desarmillaria ectypa]